MASRLGSISRPVAAFLRSAAVAAAAARRPTSTPHSSASHALPRIPRPAARGRRTGLARSLQPLHSALSAARLASRLGPGEAGVARAMSQGILFTSCEISRMAGEFIRAMLLEGTHESCIILLGRRAKSTNNGQCHQEMGLNVPR